MKILMTLMGLEIGGAETHVVELSKALKKNGHEIVVASNGGVYQKELQSVGIRHIRIPLHSKKPWLFIQSFFKLKKLFKTESFDIVHAHARIPAYICGLFAKKHSFRFVTTAHGVFKITPLWKSIAHWGEKTIAVSNDIKKYLIKNYNLWPDNISTTINGIDTEKFSKNTDFSDLQKEFSLESNKFRILYVSRITDETSLVAHMLADIMPELLNSCPNAELIIVGDGNELENLKEHCRKINQQIGHKAITLTGARTDINKFVAASNVFVGVSRSALEAMSAGVPVILAGNQGYIGFFDESKFQISYDTNYCCRGCDMPSAEAIKNELIKIYNMSENELAAVEKYNTSIIESYYSTQRMSKDYLDMYSSLSPLEHYKNGDVIINGYYGYKNIGDDSLLQAMIESIKAINQNAKITVLSASPKETSYKYSVNSIHRYDIVKIIKEMKKASLFISGGGSLLQDITSTKSLVYYTEMIKLAKKCGLKTMIYANGFGPINKTKNLNRVKNAILNADFISMREPDSAKALCEIMPELKVKITADPAFSLTPVDDKWLESLLKDYGICENQQYFAISLRDWQYNDTQIVQKISEYCNTVHKKYSLIPVFVTMQNSKDLQIIEKVKSNLNFDAPIISKISARELISVLSKMTYTIGMRLHFLIFSAVALTPSIGLSYDPKINSLLQYIGLDEPIDSKAIDVNSILEKTDELIREKDITSAKLANAVLEMREKNIKDAKDAVAIINKI